MLSEALGITRPRRSHMVDACQQAPVPTANQAATTRPRCVMWKRPGDWQTGSTLRDMTIGPCRPVACGCSVLDRQPERWISRHSTRYTTP